MNANESREADVYQDFMVDVYRQWLEEFDREAAIRRNLPRREREWRFRSGLTRLRARAQRRKDEPSPAQSLAGAQECTS
jgi:hypothetical protein